MIIQNRTWLGIATAILLAYTPAQADQLDNILNVEKQNNQVLAQSQKKIDTIADKTNTLLNEYREVTTQVDTLKVYNKQLSDLIDAQKQEIASLQKQIDYVTLVERQIMPLIQKMIDGLQEFVELDVPFRIEERRERIARLNDLMTNPNVSTAERFRQVLTAYEIEAEFGRTVDTYQAEMDIEGTTRSVNFVNVGRVAFMYQTLDREISAVWNNEAKQWEELPGLFNITVNDIIQMARGNVQSDVVRLPVFAPEEAAQ